MSSSADWMLKGNLTLKTPTLFSRFWYSMETVCKSFKKVSKNILFCINIQLILVAIHWLTQFSKFFLINLKNQLLKNTFFEGGVKIHPPSGDKGLNHRNIILLYLLLRNCNCPLHNIPGNHFIAGRSCQGTIIGIVTRTNLFYEFIQVDFSRNFKGLIIVYGQSSVNNWLEC